MRCFEARRSLSLALDGRLDAGSRRAFRLHLLTCHDCRGRYARMQSAQRLTAELPRHRVGVGFRDGLFQRISTGEGTPMGALTLVVPPTTKIRLVLLGAAAAAVVLLAGHLLVASGWFADSVPDVPRNVAGNGGGATSIVAGTHAPAAPSPEQPIAARSEPNPGDGQRPIGLRPVTKAEVAQVVAENTSQALVNLYGVSARVAAGSTTLSEVPVQAAAQDDLVPQARRFAGVVHNGYQFLTRAADDCLKIDRGFLARLRRVEPIASRLVAPQTPFTEVVRSLHELHQQQIDTLLDHPALLQDCAEPADEMQVELLRRFWFSAPGPEFCNPLGGVGLMLFTPGGGLRILHSDDLNSVLPQHGGYRIEIRVRSNVESGKNH